jgi:hypothetical protein
MLEVVPLHGRRVGKISHHTMLSTPIRVKHRVGAAASGVEPSRWTESAAAPKAVLNGC